MNNSQKGSANAFLIILIVVLAAAVIYFAFIKKPGMQYEQIPVSSSQNTPTENVSPVATYLPENTTETSSLSSSLPNKVAGWKMYTNAKFGISFQYPTNATVSEKQWTVGSGNPYEIAVNVPFINHYSSWTSKQVAIVTHTDSCSGYEPSGLTTKTVNGITYLYQDPDSDSTTGMSTQEKERNYYYQGASYCYIITEALTGPGNNERPSTATSPSDPNAFFNAELPVLDQIVSTITIK